jgi:hypothetical protein
MERPSRFAGTDSVTALKSAACWAPPARPPTICQTNSSGMLVVIAVASCEAPKRAIEDHSRVRAPKRSTSSPDGSDSTAAANVETENRAPTSKRLAPRSCAYNGTSSPRAASAAKDEPAAT